MKKTVILILLGAALAVTACETAGPTNGPETEISGNENDGGHGGAEIPEGDPSGMKGCNPCVSFGKLVRSMNYDNDVIYEFGYDEFGRYETIKVYNDNTHQVPTDILAFTYYDTSVDIHVTSMTSDGSMDSGNAVLTVDKAGHVTSFSLKNSYLDQLFDFEYDQDGYCSAITGAASSDNTWSGGNLLDGYVYFFTLENGQFTYLDKENKANVSIYDPDIFYQCRFKGLYSKNYIDTWSDEYGKAVFTYTFDDDGYVISMTADYTGNNPDDSYSATYTFSYYE